VLFIATILKKTYRGLNAFEQGFAFITLTLVFAFVFAAVICRYVLHLSTPYLEDLARFAFVANVFIGAAVVTRQKAHIKLELLPLVIQRQKVQDIIIWSLALLSLIMSGYFAYLCYGYMMSAWSAHGVSPTLGIHIGWMRSVPFIGSALWSIELTIIVVKDGLKLMKKQ